MKRIVIIGAGAGGLELAVGLTKKHGKEFKITLIDKEKTHIWKPHAHEIAAGVLDPFQEQVDYLNLAYKFGFEFIWGNFEDIDRDNKQIFLKEQSSVDNEIIIPKRTISYDNLVVSIGSSSNDFNTNGVKEYTYSLDDLPTANKFHQSLIDKILQKEYSSDLDNFRISIVGGGATGVELASELSQSLKKLSSFGLAKLKNNPVKITVINAADQLLPGLSQKISLGAKAILEEANVTVLNNAKVTSISKNQTFINQNGKDFCLVSDLIVWAAGVKSSDVLKKFNLKINKINQLLVDENLRTEDPSIFAIGDCCSVNWINSPKENMTVPPRAQAAHQMSDYLVKNWTKLVNNDKTKPFVYKDYGSLISLGSTETVGTLMGFMKGKSLFVEGKIAKFFYINLYYHHQVKINGVIPTFFMFSSKVIQKTFKPKVKLH